MHERQERATLIRLQTSIHAPPQRCFDLARSVDLHTRSAAHTGERAVAGLTTGLLGPGDTVTWEARHLGLRHRLTVRITRFEPPRLFEDRLVRGPFRSLRHLHEFLPADDGTLMRDTFAFRSAFGPLSDLLDRLVLAAYLRRFLIKRNRCLKWVAEDPRAASRVSAAGCQPKPGDQP